MINVYIFEDDYIFQNRLLKILEGYNNKENDTRVFHDVTVVEHKHMELLDEIQVKGSHLHNLFLIDVDLKKSYTGFDLAKKIRSFDHLSNIIFITSHIELMSNVFLLNLKVMSYIYKLDPLLEVHLTSSLEAIEKEVKTIQQSSNNMEKQEGAFSFNDKGNYYKLPFSSIIAIETDPLKRKVRVITEERVYECRKTIKEILIELPDYFMKSHRAIVLNSNHINEVKTTDSYYEAVMTNNECYSISRNFVKAILGKFTKNSQ